jgi:metallophosphoesterase (TIGR00282 family)
MLKILFIGDINGKIGRKAVAKLLPGIKKEVKPDLVIANAENSAHGSGVTENTLKELQASGIDWMTNGDHAFKTLKQLELYNKYPILRPANYSHNVPGRGYAIITIGSRRPGGTSKNILLINLIGRVFMHLDYDCPFRKLNEILANPILPEKKLSAIIVDIHAEATSEKTAMGHFADGKVSAVLGTHTHIMTADYKVTEKGTAYITDVGMVGAADSCLGVDKENIIKTFLTQIKYPHVIPEKGPAIFNSVLITINPKTVKATSIKPITKIINIK